MVYRVPLLTQISLQAKMLQQYMTFKAHFRAQKGTLAAVCINWIHENWSQVCTKTQSSKEESCISTQHNKSFLLQMENFFLIRMENDVCVLNCFHLEPYC